jgi:murein L,D-transpeptidase YafK
MKPSAKHKVFIILASGLLISGTIFFVLNQFFIMPWENTDLSALENPRLVIKKNERLLQIFEGERLVKTYEIVLGFAPAGDKEFEGDGKTPEGEFYVFVKNDKSKFYLSLGVSYPGIDDAKRGLAENVITREEHDAIVEAIGKKQMPPQNTRLGGEIYIHGGGTRKDWTQGCIALGNEEMKELFEAIPLGAPLRIEP